MPFGQHRSAIMRAPSRICAWLCSLRNYCVAIYAYGANVQPNTSKIPPEGLEPPLAFSVSAFKARRVTCYTIGDYNIILSLPCLDSNQNWKIQSLRAYRWQTGYCKLRPGHAPGSRPYQGRASLPTLTEHSLLHYPPTLRSWLSGFRDLCFTE